MNMAADWKGAGAGKIHLDRLARRLLVPIKAHAARIDVDLVEKFVVIGKQQAVAAGDRDLAEGEGAALLDDAVHRRSTQRGRDEQQGSGDDQAIRLPSRSRRAAYGG